MINNGALCPLTPIAIKEIETILAGTITLGTR